LTSQNNLESKFESLVAQLSIPENLEKLYRHGIHQIFTLLHGDHPHMTYYDYNPHNYGLRLLTPFYGGSFDRHTCIQDYSDIDAYFLYKDLTPDKDLSGEDLFNKILSQIDFLQQTSYYYRGYTDDFPRIKLLRDHHLRHAVPIEVDFQRERFKLDCIPAIQLNSENDLLIPHYEETTKVNPTKDYNALRRLNVKYNGRITKFILLIKYWNEINEHILKSYLIERLVEKIFSEH